MKIGVVVNYSTIDHFLWSHFKPMIEAIGDEVIVVRKTHLFSGDPEELHDLGVPTLTMPHVNAADPITAFKVVPQMRMAGVMSLSPHCTHYLFLDSDELFEVEQMKAAVRTASGSGDWFCAHWYWRNASHRAVQKGEGGAFFCSAESLVRPAVMIQHSRRDRSGMTPTHYRMIGRDKPFCHHFSWAKPLDQMLRKVASWGHKGDRDSWESQVRAEWSRDLPSACDFVHGYDIERCENQFGIYVP